MLALDWVSPMADSNRRSLADKVAIVTGGASGIGAGTVRRLVDDGASVLITDLDEERGKALADELGDAASFLRTDVSKEEDISAAMLEVVDLFGGLDILFSNAGFGGALGPIVDTSVDDFDLTFDVLVKSVFLGVKHATPLIAERGGGSIINTASICGLRPGWGPHLYTTAKAAVIAFTQTAALELAESGVRCNAICPGFIATPLAYGRPDASTDQIDKMRNAGANSQPMGRVGEPADIAAMVSFLASEDGSWITGQAITVDGGMNVGPLWGDFPEAFRTSKPIRHHRPPDR